ncbi:MAG: D-sedoheptulose 7-phosphate isomerase [Acidobacteriota bacterium]|nr:D-sedoheptulose 7-phosphate isomerase [Acidobacteriota bacterium]
MSKAANDFSRAFYPFLHDDEEKKPQELMEELRFSLTEKARESVDVKTRFFEENKDTILAASLEMAKAFQRGRKLLVCGNGGSATDAQHIAVEFMHPVIVGRKALPAICLTNDMAMVTAVANDVGFDDVFTRQIIALGNEGDILLGISTSGNSENLMHAFATARRMKLITIGYAGNDGGKMAEMCTAGALDFCLNVPTSSIHRIQETHVALYHITWDMVHTFLQHKSLLGEESGVESLESGVKS